MTGPTTELPPEHRPMAHSLPALPPADFFSPLGWETLWALLDGILPAISDRPPLSRDAIVLGEAEFDGLMGRARGARMRPADGGDEDDDEKVREFFGGRWTDDQAFRDDVVRMLALSPAKGKLSDLLEKLNTRTGSLALTGYWTPVTRQPTSVRHAIIQSWHASYFVTLRGVAKSLTSIALKAMSSTSSAFPKITGYTDVPRGWAPRTGHDFNFMQLPPPPKGDDDAIHVIETDVVVVGSGCGGGVCAKNLAEAGHSVLVVDKGYHFPPSQLPMAQTPACQYLFDNGGLYLTEDSSAFILAGGAWGGGGTVNWSVCLRPQDFVREEWAAEGLDFFAGRRFDDCLDRVWDFMGAGADAIRHNHRNNVVLDGCKKLGYQVGVPAQNTAGKEHYCGQCHLGCGAGEKRGPAVSWLPAAADAGAEFMEGFKVDKVVFADDGVTAVGVEGEWVSRGPGSSVSAPRDERVVRKARINAKRVIISSGTFWSPVILMNSGVENPQVGKNLHLHPANPLTATYNEETKPWEGGIITSYSGEFENLDGKGHGAKIETTCMVPYTSLSSYPWRSGEDFKLFLLKYPRLASFISLVRDRDTGSVFRDNATGNPRIKYSISDFDREHGLEGTIGLCKICYATGATEIQPYFPGLEPWVASPDGPPTSVADGEDPEFADPRFAAWLGRVRAVGNKPPIGIWASAHQMGTCRMAASPEKGVVDAAGKVWGREGLYVADASVFPSASGVNPMVTVMAISDWISRRVADDLAAAEAQS